MEPDERQSLFEGLQELSAGSFPKVCPNCGRVYSNLQQFLAETVPIVRDRSGLKASADDDDHPVVELFRNCACGSTLMDFCRSRRDETADGQRRRDAFDRMLELAVGRGVEQETARAELLKLVRGEPSELIIGLLRR
jgi:hypothetical protein